MIQILNVRPECQKVLLYMEHHRTVTKSRKDTSAYDMMEYHVTNEELKKRGYH